MFAKKGQDIGFLSLVRHINDLPPKSPDTDKKDDTYTDNPPCQAVPPSSSAVLFSPKNCVTYTPTRRPQVEGGRIVTIRHL